MDGQSRFFALMTGKLLGDGCITRQQGRLPRFQFMHRKDDYDWTQHCYDSLKSFIPVNPPAFKRVSDKRLAAGFSEAYYVQSKTHEIITLLESNWYKNRKKNLPKEFIQTHFNVESLAWWYQDDGHLKVEQGIPRKIILSTDSFSREENHFLTALLESRFKLFFSLDGQNRLILYDQFQIVYFLRLVGPYIHASMNRKLIYDMPLKKLPQRTTIYLPDSIILEKPTREINHALDRLETLHMTTLDSDLYNELYLGNIERVRLKSNLKSYQVVLTEKNRYGLSLIRKNTGLSVSQAAEWCFDNV